MMDTSEKDGREMECVVLPSAPVQSESTADGDAAVLTPHIQPQLTSAPSLETRVNLCTAVWVCHSHLTNKSNASRSHHRHPHRLTDRRRKLMRSLYHDEPPSQNPLVGLFSFAAALKTHAGRE